MKTFTQNAPLTDAEFDRMVKYDFGGTGRSGPGLRGDQIHKAQGSEFPAVVIPLAMRHYMLLQRT